MNLLNTICNNLEDCRIVISSDWRYDMQSCTKRLYNAGLEGLIIGKTPEYIWRERLKDDAPTRGSEIKEWCDINLTPEDTYCIVDDRTDFLPEQMDHFVHVDPMWGLQPKHVLQIMRILSNDNRTNN